VKSDLRMASPPAKPLMVFDGECNFCRFWIRRWQHTTGNAVDYLPFQDPSLAVRFPELPPERFVSAVHLLETDGSVYSGAEAAFRALAHNPHERWLVDWYEHSPAFTHVTEWAYRLVAGNRTFFSALTRLGWGQHVEPPAHLLVRWVFLRSLGLIYLLAFVSLWVQINGLIGGNGIEPAKLTMESVRQGADMQKLGWDRYHRVPTLCWFNTSDGFLKSQCAAGTALAVLLTIGVAPAPCLFLLWLIYLSLATICGVFLGFQWDILLLEVGFLAIFFAPLQMLPAISRAARPSRIVLWLLRWLLFRLMFESGCVKLLSGDPSWRNLTALNFHYETQPLPTWIGWYVHQLPPSAQKISTALMFGIELAVPFLIFCPRRLRQFGCVLLTAFQVVIFLTGNYCFFNLLAIALCLLLLDDAALKKFVPARWRNCSCFNQQSELKETVSTNPSLASSDAVSQNPSPSPDLRASPVHLRRWPRQITVPLACVTIAISLMQFSRFFRVRVPWPRPMAAVEEWLMPLRTFNTYGLFAVMTTSRPEIILEGSNDAVTWLPYEFKYKPGDVKRRPTFVAPHQPRLDWQMWFAALSSYQYNPWLINCCLRLLQGSPQVLALLERNPFPNAPPRYIRAVVYDYHFTDPATRRETGAWWRRELKGRYLPVISLREGRSEA